MHENSHAFSRTTTLDYHAAFSDGVASASPKKHAKDHEDQDSINAHVHDIKKMDSEASSHVRPENRVRTKTKKKKPPHDTKAVRAWDSHFLQRVFVAFFYIQIVFYFMMMIFIRIIVFDTVMVHRTPTFRRAAMQTQRVTQTNRLDAMMMMMQVGILMRLSPP